jgi:hypothetical protein
MKNAYAFDRCRGRIPLVMPEASTTLPSIPGCAVREDASIILTEGKQVAQSHVAASYLDQTCDCVGTTSAEFLKAILNSFNQFEGAAKWRV